MFAQQEQTTKSEPLELPNFIIQGKLQLDVATGIKQDPSKPKSLDAGLLDSVNSLDKQPSILINTNEIIPQSYKQNIANGYLGANFGRYSTGNIYGAFNSNLEGYNVDLNGDFDFGSGHLDKANFTGANLQLTSDYIAPLKFFIFGGSRTRTNIEYHNRNYWLYSNPTNPAERTANHFIANINVDGNYAGFKFNTGIGFSGLQFSANEINTADNNFKAFLKIHRYFDKLLLAGNIILDLHSIAGASANFIQFDGEISLLTADISLRGNAGLQMAGNKSNVDRGGLLLAGSIEYRMNKLFTLKGNINSGLERKTLTDNFYQNPYLSNFTDFDYSYNILNLDGIIEFHPDQELVISAKFNLNHSDRIPVYINTISSSNGSFDISYQTGTIIKSVFEGNYNLTNVDKISANLTAIQSTLSDFTSKSIPYTPEITFGSSYTRNWSEKFGTIIGFDYIGQRYVDLDNSKFIDAYTNVKLGLEYNILEKLKINANFDNLLNSDIYIWNGYKERGIFASFGVRYKF